MYTYRLNGYETNLRNIKNVLPKAYYNALVEELYHNTKPEYCIDLCGYQIHVIHDEPEVGMMEEIGLMYRCENDGEFEFGYSGYDSFYIHAKDGEFYFYRGGTGEIGQKEDRSPARFGIDEAAAVVEFCNYNFPNWEREQTEREIRIHDFEKVHGRPFRPDYDVLDDADYEPRLAGKVVYKANACTDQEYEEDMAKVWKQRGF